MQLIQMARNLAIHHSMETVAAFLSAAEAYDKDLYENIKYAIDWNMLGWDEIAGYIAHKI